MAVEAVNKNPWNEQLDFARFFADIYDDLTGRVSTIEERGATVLSDGTRIPQLVQVAVRDPSATPICNETGAKYLIHHIKLLFNKHVSMGKLKHDEIVDITENAVRVPIMRMMVQPKQYGVNNTSAVADEGYALGDAVYTFLTSIEGGGMREWGSAILDVKVENREPQPQKQQVAAPGLYG